MTRLLLAVAVVSALAGCGGGTDDRSADVAAAVEAETSARRVACERSDLEYAGDEAYGCRVDGKRRCYAYVDGELIELWDERPLRPGEPGYTEGIGATVRTGPSC